MTDDAKCHTCLSSAWHACDALDCGWDLLTCHTRCCRSPDVTCSCTLFRAWCHRYQYTCICANVEQPSIDHLITIHVENYMDADMGVSRRGQGRRMSWWRPWMRSFKKLHKGAFTGRAARIRRGAARSSGLKPDGPPAPVPRKIRLISQCFVLVKCCELTTFVQQKFNVSNIFENFVIF